MIEELFGLLLGNRLGRSRVVKRNRALIQSGKVELGVRVVEGSVPGFSKEWLHAVADLGDHRISIGSRVMRVERTEGGVRQPAARELVSVDGDADICLLVTPNGRVEMAVMKELRGDVFKLLGLTSQ